MYSIMSVSYTHLDVYKRQILFRADLTNGITGTSQFLGREALNINEPLPI